MLERLIERWVYGGFLAGLLLLLLTPLLSQQWSAALLWVWLQLPLYMLHQLEEHDDDRFRLFFNRTLGGGQQMLTPVAVFVINVPGVWGVIAGAVYLARFVELGYGLIAVYLTLINAITHIVHAAVFRSYNPGLITAVTLFLPGSLIALSLISEVVGVGMGAHLLGIAVAIGIHAAIIGYVKTRQRSLDSISNADGV